MKKPQLTLSAISPIENQNSKIKNGLAGQLVATCPLLAILATGCQMLSYTSPTGERFTRTSFAATTQISSLSLESTTNGIRRVELRGYTNDSAQALGTVTEAAVKAAIQGAK